jgi:hypothetical protein
MYIPENRYNPKETSGHCLDAPNPDASYQRCSIVIANGYCYRDRKTPVLP